MDSTGDGLLDGEEVLTLGTDPNNADTDGDMDGFEVRGGLDPFATNFALADPDKDGLNNGDEQLYGTLPLVADTDGDGTNDGDEVAAGTDPLGSSALVPALGPWGLTLLVLCFAFLGSRASRALAGRPA